MTEEATTFIQWKGTDVCMDLRCSCGAHNHVHGEFAYFIACGKCGQVYEMGTSITATPLDKMPDLAGYPIEGMVL